MSGYYLLLHAVTGALGDGLLAVRLASVLGGVATVALTGLLALRLFDRRVATAAGLLAAVSLPLVFWSQSARGYSLMVALVVGSCLAFAGLERRGGHGRAAWIAYVACTSLAVYFSFVAVLIVPAQLVVLPWRRPAARRTLLALLACVAGWVPLVVLAASRGTGQLFWVPRPTLTGENQVLQALTSAGLQPSFHRTSTTAVLEALTVLLGVLAAALGRGAWARAGRGEGDWRRALVLAWVAVPVGIAWVESLVGQPVLLPRNLLFALPAVALLLALGLADPRVPRPLAVALLGAVIALRALQVGAAYRVSPEPWNGATGYVLARASAGDCVAFYPSDGRMAFDYYLRTRRGPVPPAPRPVLPATPWTRVMPFVEDYATLGPAGVKRVARGCPRLWLISSHEGEPDGPAASRANRARYLRLRADLAAVYADRHTTVFGYASPIHVERFAAPSPSRP